METSGQSVPKWPSTDLNAGMQHENLTEPLQKGNNNIESKQQRFTSSVAINRFKTSNGDVSIIIKSEHDSGGSSQRLYNTSLIHNTLKTGEGDVRIIISSSNSSFLNNPASTVLFDSSDTLRFDVEKLRLCAEEKRLEVESERMDAEFRKTDREGWLKKQEIRIKELEVKKLELMKPNELNEIKQCKFKVHGKLVKHVGEDSEILNSVNSRSENYAFSGEIFVNQESDSSESLIASSLLEERSESTEVEKGKLDKTAKAESKPREDEVSLDSILKHQVVRDNLELRYGLTDRLIEDKALSSEAEEDIKREGKTRYERCDILLQYINNSNLESFLDGLRKTLQSHLAAFIHCRINKTEREPDKSKDWPLDEEERKTINKLYCLLVNEITISGMLDELFSKNCVSEAHMAFINECIVKNKFGKNRELLDIMRRRSKEQLKKFWELVIKYNNHLKDIIEKFHDNSNTLTLIKVNTQDNLTEEQKQKVKDNLKQPHHRPSNRNENEPNALEEKQINFFVSGEEIFAIVPVAELAVDSSSMIVSDEIKSAVKESLIRCIGGKRVIVETLENLEYKEDIVEIPENLEYKEDKTIDKKHENELSDEEKIIFSWNTFTSIIKVKEAVVGVTVVNDKIFVVQKNQSSVNVYNLSTLTALPDISIPDMKDPVGIAGCSHNKVLYIRDYELQCIRRVNITDNSVKRWRVRENYEPRGLTVTSEHNVLVTVWIRDTKGNYVGESKVVEYTSEGQLIREIKLDKSIGNAYQTLELSTDQFIISHGLRSSLHRVCVINSDGEIMKCFGGKRGGGEGQLKDPRSLTIDKNRQVVFVADTLNSRVVMLDYEMNYLGLVKSRESLWSPSRLYFDLNSDQLIVADWRWFSSRLLIISQS